MITTVLTIVFGLILLLALFALALALVIIVEAASGNAYDLEYYDDTSEDDVLDETNHIRPLLGVVHPKEK